MRNLYMIIGVFKCNHCQEQMIIVKCNDSGSVSVMPRTEYDRIIWKERKTRYRKRFRKFKKHRKNIERSRKLA